MTLVALTVAQVATAFDLFTDESGIYVIAWERGLVPMQLNLPNGPTYSDGTTPRSSVEEAMRVWNTQLGNVQFAWSFGEEGVYEVGNDSNEIAMDSAIDGFEFGSNTLAVTVSFNDGNYRAESDLIFNTAWTWDSYRGDLQRDVVDIQRVALHELGHSLGLAHPDQADPSQSVKALMNSLISDLDTLQDDDVTGGQYLYGPRGRTPINDHFSDAIVVDLMGQTSVTGRAANWMSTSEAGEPILDGEYPGYRTVWWKWTAPETIKINVNTVGSRFDTVLGVFSGTQLTDLVQIGVNDDIDPGIVRTSSVNFVAEAGATYYFLVDGWGGYEGWINFTLQVLDSPAKAVSMNHSRVVGSPGESLELTVSTAAEMGTSLSYQWRYNNRDIPGATAASYTIEGFNNSDAGAYSVGVTDAGGSVTYVTAFVLPNYGETELKAWTTDERSGNQDVPPGLKDVVLMEAGQNHVLAVRTGGRVVGWGGQQWDQVDHYEAPPFWLDDVVRVSAGVGHSLALRANGTVVAWGGSAARRATVPEGLDEVVAISAGGEFSVALKADGSVVMWDFDGDAQYSLGANRDVVDVHCHGYSVFLLHEDGSVADWNRVGSLKKLYPAVDWTAGVSAVGTRLVRLEENGRVSTQPTSDKDESDGTNDLHNVFQIARGPGGYGYLLRADGKLKRWRPAEAWSSSDIDWAELEEVVSVSGSDSTLLTLQSSPATQTPVFQTVPEPTTVVEGQTIVLSAKMAGGNPLSYVWKRNGVAVESGLRVEGNKMASLEISFAEFADAGNYTVEVSNAAGTVSSPAIAVEVLTGVSFSTRPMTQIAVEGDAVVFNAVAMGTGELRYQWWYYGTPLEGRTSSTLELTNVAMSDAGRYSLQVTDARGAAWTQCFLHVGAIDGEAVNLDSIGGSKANVPAMTLPVVQLETNKGVMALRSDGTISVWGGAPPGPLDLAGIVEIALGKNHALALKADGTVVAWGSNYYGQTTVPNGMTDVVAIEAGDSVSVALKADGSVVAWGRMPMTLLPSRVRDAVDVSINAEEGVLLRRNGRLLAWNSANVPPPVSENIVMVSAGWRSAAVVLSDGSLRWWGAESAIDPPTVTNLENVVEIDFGVGGGAARDSLGTIYTFSNEGRLSSVEIEQPENVVGIAVGAAIVRKASPEVSALSAGVDVMSGDEISLTVEPQESGAYIFEWFRDGEALAPSDRIEVAYDGTLKISQTTSNDSGNYSVRISNVSGFTLSENVPVVVRARPVPLQWPTYRSVVLGTETKIDLTATESGVTYEWRHRGELMSSQPGAVLSIPNMDRSHAGYYDVLMTAESGGVLQVGFTLAIAPVDGVIKRWGSDSEDNVSIPRGLGSIVQYAWGGPQGLALTNSGTVISMQGSLAEGLAVPADLQEVVQVAVGFQHALVLQADGTVRAWGGDYGGRKYEVPEGLPPIASISAWGTTSVALSAEGQVFVWSGVSGAASVPLDHPRMAAATARDLLGYAVISVAGELKVVRGGGGVVPPLPDGLGTVVGYSSDSRDAIAIKSDGSVILLPEASSVINGSIEVDWSNIDQVAVSYGFVLGVNHDGDGFGAGLNDFGQTDIPTTLGPIYQIGAGSQVGLALVAGDPERFAISEQPRGLVAEGGTATKLSVVAKAQSPLSYQWYYEGQAMTNDARISGVTSPDLIIGQTSELDRGRYKVQISNGSEAIFSSEVYMDVDPQDQPLVWSEPLLNQRMAAGDSITINAEIEGSIGYRWRFLRREIPYQRAATLALNSVQESDEGYYEVLAISPGGAVSRSVFYVQVAPANVAVEEVHAEGQQAYGVPDDIGEAVAVSSTDAYHLVLRRDGTLKVWGAEAESISDQVEGLTDVTAIASDRWFSVVLTGRGRVHLLGDYLQDYLENPEMIASIEDAVAVAIGDSHILVLHADGTLSAFGDDSSGQSTVPEGLYDVVAIAATSGRSMALRSDGEIVVWGWDNNGLGQDGIPDDLGDVVQIATSTYYNLVKRRDRTLVAWGKNSNVPKIPNGLGPVVNYSTRNVLTMVNSSGRVVVIPPGTANRALVDLFDVVQLGGAYPRWVGLVRDERPTLTLQPEAKVLTEGDVAEFQIVATGAGALHYQWRRNGVNLHDGDRISGSQRPVLKISELKLEDRGNYDVVVSDDQGTIISRKALLYPLQPQISLQPNTTISSPTRYTALTVKAEESPLAVTYQWYRGKSGDTTFPVAGVDGDTWVITNGTESGRYWVRVSNEFAHADSDDAILLWFDEIGEINQGSSLALFYRDGRYLAMGAGGVFESTDAITWTQTSDKQFTLGKLASGRGAHVFAGWAHSHHSTDLVTWQDLSVDLQDVVFDGTAFVGTNANGIHRSADGLEWTKVDDFVAAFLLQGDGVTIAINESSWVKKSTDGVNWVELGYSGFSVPWRGMVADGRFLVWSRDGWLMESRDGASWTRKWKPVTSVQYLNLSGMAHGEGLTLAFGQDSFLVVDGQGGYQFNLSGSPGGQLFDGHRFLFTSSNGDLFATSQLSPDFDASTWSTELVTELGTPVNLRALPDASRALIRWYEGKTGDTENPLLNDEGPVIEVNPAVTTEYWARIIQGIKTIDTETVVVRVEIRPPVIAGLSDNAVLTLGSNHQLEVSATGTAPLRYQWFHNGQPLSGATQSTLGLSEVRLSNAGRYAVQVENSAGMVRSREVVLSVLPAEFSVTATHEAGSTRYVPGGSVTVSGVVNFDESVTAVSWSVLLPTGWSLSAVGPDDPETGEQPAMGTQDLLEWSWSALGESPLAFSFTLGVPTTQRGLAEITSLVGVTVGGAEVQLLANPDPLKIVPALHSADMDGNQRLSLSELLRVIELYNTRFGSSRTGRYRISATSIDGFEPDGRDLSIGESNTRFHSADHSLDGRLSLSELLRVIELYNTRSGSTRTGAYRLQSDSVDGFAPGAE